MLKTGQRLLRKHECRRNSHDGELRSPPDGNDADSDCGQSDCPPRGGADAVCDRGAFERAPVHEGQADRERGECLRGRAESTA